METEDYNPEPPKFYEFRGKKSMNQTVNKPLNTFKNVNIFAYEVRTNAKAPFMQVLLTKSTVSHELIFPVAPLLVSINSTEELVDYVKVCLFGILNYDDFEVFDSKITFNGFYETNQELYLFFEISKVKLQLDDIFLNSSLRFALIDEMIHFVNVCNIPIHQSIWDFFWCNFDFRMLDDENGEAYEMPMVAYISKPNNRLNYSYIFGETKSDASKMFGSYYYFTTYKKAFEDACKIDGLSGIVRYALFVGAFKYVGNYFDDPIDMSEMKVLRLTDETNDLKKERLTMRITDYDGKWAENYDGLVLGHVELDNGELLDDYTLVVKEYEQQQPLSIHYVNKATLKGVEENYSIL
jgi:hypothetical protein